MVMCVVKYIHIQQSGYGSVNPLHRSGGSVVRAFAPWAGGRGIDPQPRHTKDVIKMVPDASLLSSEGIWLSGKTLDCRPRDCEFDPPSLQLKLLKRRYVLVLPRKNALVYQCFTLGTLKNLVCHVWWPPRDSPCI